jgi:O-antigen/teichoic acid export membrane protein
VTESPLRRKVASGFQWNGLAAGISALIQLALLLVFVRSLTPEDFGLYSLVLVVAGFGQVFSDMGFTNAIVYKQSATDLELSSIFWLSILIGSLLFLAVFLSAGWAGGFFGEPRLARYVRWIGLVFLIQPWGQFFFALLQREMRFSAIAKIEILSRSVQLVSTLALLGAGFGIQAFIWGLLAWLLCRAALLAARGRTVFMPSPRFVPGAARDLATFGLFQMGERIANYFVYQIDVLLIGKLFGSQSLGFYNVAKQVALKPSQILNPIITGVVFPVLSKHQDNPPLFTRIFRRTVHLTTFLNLPVCAALFVFADHIAAIVLGGEWITAGTLLRILSVFAAVRSFLNPSGILALARGKARWGFLYAVAQLVLVPTVILLASSTSIVGVSIAQVVLATAMLAPNWFLFVRTLTDDSFASFHGGPWRVLVATAVASGAAMAILNMVGQGPLHLTLGATVLLGLTGLLLWAIDRPMWLLVTDAVHQRLRAFARG